MSTSPGPQRPNAAVYRRRRLVVGVLALVVLGLLVWGVVAGVRGVAGLFDKGEEKSSSATASGTPKPGPASSSTPTPAGANPDGSCPAGAVAITAGTDKQSYGANEKPVLLMKLKNSLDDPCTLDVGTKNQEFLITSGSDRIYSTKDCQADGESTELELEPGKEETARFTWDRERSQAKCEPISVKPRAGTYTLKVTLGKLESKPVQFSLN
ncbi:MAG: hypothetical protein ACTMIK_04815 [Galactobacter sp.]